MCDVGLSLQLTMVSQIRTLSKFSGQSSIYSINGMCNLGGITCKIKRNRQQKPSLAKASRGLFRAGKLHSVFSSLATPRYYACHRQCTSYRICVHVVYRVNFLRLCKSAWLCCYSALFTSAVALALQTPRQLPGTWVSPNMCVSTILSLFCCVRPAVCARVPRRRSIDNRKSV